jgi:MFS family permease
MNRRYLGFTYVAALFTLGNFSDAFLGLRAQEAGMLPAVIPLAFFAFNMTSSLFSMPVGMLSVRIGRRSVLIMGFLIFSVIYFGFGMADRGLFRIMSLRYKVTSSKERTHAKKLTQQSL